MHHVRDQERDLCFSQGFASTATTSSTKREVLLEVFGMDHFTFVVKETLGAEHFWVFLSLGCEVGLTIVEQNQP